MPYKMVRRTRKGKTAYVVVKENADGSAGKMVPGGSHPTRAKALAHMRALYANVPDARTR